MNDFNEWIFPGITKAKASDPPPAKAADVANVPETKPAENAVHITVGEDIKKRVPSVAPTKDLYGKGAQAHGSPWKGALEDVDAVKTALRQMGYRPKGKNIWVRGKVEVDIGTDSESMYLYITDDNKIGK